MAEGSKIFTPYRALGLVSTNIPLLTRYIHQRKEHLITTVVGNTFHTYGSSKLKLLSVGSPHKSPIIAMAGDTYHVYTSCNKTIYAWRRGTELKAMYVGHKADVHLMQPFGPHLIAIDKLNVMCLWDIKAKTLLLEMDFPTESFAVSAIVHPATYINKVLLGSKQGKMQLWNLNTCKVLYNFVGWDSAICVLKQAPALDVIAVGLNNGKIILHNIKYDESIVEFAQEWGRVTSISFRTDGFPVMVTGSEIGHLALWDLKERKLLSQVRFVHRGLVAGLECLPGEPLMITSSPDNSLKMWIFDLPDGGARLLKLVEGHSAPPLCARFYGITKVLGDNVITAGEDSSVMCFSTVADINKNFGFASYNRKSFKRLHDKTKIMPAITRFAFETTKERIWDGAAAIHYGHSLVTTWSFYSQTMGQHKLQHERFKEDTYRHCVATCLDLTACGNFVIIGYDSGHIDKFNMQSGQHRGSFGNPVAHVGGVQDLAADGINMFVVSGGQEGDLKWWRKRDSSCIKTLSLDESISKMFLHRDSGLLGVALEDWSIQVVDVDTKCVVRKLYGHHNQLTDIAFSPDSKWLISSSMDKTIRTWDIPSGACVDCFAVPIPCTSIAVSPSGDFLATVHTDQLGVYLWSNKALFHHISLRPLTSDHQAATVCLPSAGAAEFQVADAEETVEDTKDEDEEYISPQQISEELITLAMLPTSRWLNLLSLDVIKKRNKPIEPAKVPKSAPFFIPTVPGLEFKFAPTETEKSATNSKVKPVKSFEVLTDFGKKLKAGEYEIALKMLMDQGPSGVEVEIRGLDPDVGGSEEVMIQFLEMVRWALTMQCNFEAVQGYLGLFLKLHANYIMDNSAVSEKCEELYAVQGKAWHKIRDSMDQTLSLVSYFKNAALISY